MANILQTGAGKNFRNALNEAQYYDYNSSDKIFTLLT